MSAVVVKAVALLCECLCVFPVDVVDRLAAVVIGKAWESIEREKKRPRDYLTVCCHPDGTTSPPPPALMWLTLPSQLDRLLGAVKPISFPARGEGVNQIFVRVTTVQLNSPFSCQCCRLVLARWPIRWTGQSVLYGRLGPSYVRGVALARIIIMKKKRVMSPTWYFFDYLICHIDWHKEFMFFKNCFNPVEMVVC